MFFANLETERLLLKSIGKEDTDFFLKQFSNDAVNRYLFDSEPCASIEEAKKWVDFYLQDEPRNYNRWILIKKDTGEKIGTCGFHCWNREAGESEIGWDLYPDFWHQGYMSEALMVALRFAEQEMKLKKLEAHIPVENAASIKLADKHGFVSSGKTYYEKFRGEKYLHGIFVRDFPCN